MSEKQPAKHPGFGVIFGAYWRQVREYPLSTLGILLSACMVQGAFLFVPLFTRQLINLLSTNQPSPEIVHTLYVIVGLITAVWFVEWVANRTRGLLVTKLQSQVMALLQIEAFSYLLGHSHNFFTSNFAGSLAHKVRQYARSFEMIFDAITFQFFPTFLFVVGAVIVLGLQNVVLGAMLGVWSICFVIFQLWVASLRQPIRVQRANADSAITAGLADAVSNQQTVMLFSAATYEQRLFGDIVERWRIATNRLWRVDDYIWGGIGLFIMLIEAGLMFGGVYFWQHGQLTIGDFVLMQAYLFVTFERLVNINRELRGFYTALAEAGEMFEILRTPHEIQDASHAPKLAVSKGDIKFSNVTFHFHKERGVLDNFNLKITGGQKVALVGPSGAGKSTITKLLLRFYDVISGDIKIDDQNITEVTQDSLRDAISFVPQEPILFHRTLMENIRYGKRDATDEEVIAAAKKAHCDEFISQLPLKYDTYVGERGVKLSGGERQRVAIARAILKNAPILVLDEATSSLDSESEALIQDALRVLMEGKTVIVIAHRLSTIMKMDRIIVIDAGAIVADGTHAALLEQEGLYKKLWSVQAGGFLLDDADLLN